jgi:hypothetical protein
MEDLDASVTARLVTALLPLVGQEVRAEVMNGKGRPLVVIHGRLQGSCDLDPIDEDTVTLAVGTQLLAIELDDVVGVWEFEFGDEGRVRLRGVSIGLHDHRSIDIAFDPGSLSR